MRVIVLLSIVHVIAEAFCRFNTPMKISKCKTSRSPSSPVVFSSSIEDLLREKFIKKMISNSTKIFSCWPNFEKSLPRRKYNVKGTELYIPLYTLEYYARDDDLQRFANEIMEPPKESEQIRTWVKYIAAPSCSGKTTCILPAFLKTTLTHYFYIAFDNNQNNNYQFWSESSLISKIPDKARLQGADFMLQCIKRFLDSLLPGPHQIEGNLNPPRTSTRPKMNWKNIWTKNLEISISVCFIWMNIAKCAREFLRTTRAKIFPEAPWSYWQEFLELK